MNNDQSIMKKKNCRATHKSYGIITQKSSFFVVAILTFFERNDNETNSLFFLRLIIML